MNPAVSSRETDPLLSKDGTEDGRKCIVWRNRPGSRLSTGLAVQYSRSAWDCYSVHKGLSDTNAFPGQ